MKDLIAGASPKALRLAPGYCGANRTTAPRFDRQRQAEPFGPEGE